MSHACFVCRVACLAAELMSPEEKTLLRCLRSLVSGEPVEIIGPLDWLRLYDLAAGHNLQPILSAVLPADSLPDEVAGHLSHDSRRRRARAAVMIDDFQTIHHHLTAAGIQVMPIKGVYLAHAIYPSVSQRYFDDLDLLIPAEAGPAALQVLQSLDFVIHPRVPQPDWHHLPPHVHRQHNTMVELHTDLLRRARPGWNIDQIWRRARRGKLAGQDTWLMSDEDALIYTALHARHNLYNRLSYMLDGALLAKRLGLDHEATAECHEELAELVDEAGAHCALAYTLETANRLLELNLVPVGDCPRLRRRLAQGTASWQTLSPGRSSLRQGPLPRFIEILLMDSMGDSLRLAWRLVMPPPEFVASAYGQQIGPGGTRAGYGKRLWQRISLATGQIRDLIRDR